MDEHMDSQMPDNLYEELVELNDSAKELIFSIEKSNFLPEDFPRDQIKGICESLGRLKDGSPEGAKTSLDYSVRRLTRIRRDYIKIDRMQERLEQSDIVDRVFRGMNIDRAIATVIVSCQTALDEYYYISGQREDYLQPIERLTDSKNLDKSATIDQSIFLEEKIYDARVDIADMIEQNVAGASDLNRKMIDVTNQNALIRQELSFNKIISSVLERLVVGISKYPSLLKISIENIEGAIKIFRPYWKRWNDFTDNFENFVIDEIVKTLETVKNTIIQLEDLRRSQESTSFNDPSAEIDPNQIAREILLRGEPIPDQLRTAVTALQLCGTKEKRAFVERFDSVIDLPNLHSLNLSYCDIPDRVDIAKLDTVREFTFEPINEAQIAPVAYMKELNSLTVFSDYIHSTGAIGRCRNLKQLKISSNSLNDIYSLKTIETLQEFGIFAPNVADFSSIAGNIGLESIRIQSNFQKNHFYLRKKTNLRMLNISSRNTKHINSVSDCVKLSHIDINSNSMVDLYALSQCSMLESAILNCNSLSDISFLRRLRRIKNLQILSNKIADVEPISYMNNVEQLTLNGILINDLSPLCNLVKLRKLNIDQCKVETLDFLRNLQNIEELSIQQTSVFDLRPLLDLVKLKKIKARNVTALNWEVIPDSVEVIR